MGVLRQRWQALDPRTRRRLRVVAAVAAGLAVAVIVGVVIFSRGDGGAPEAVAPTPTATPGGPWINLQLPPDDNRFSMVATAEDVAGVREDSQFVFSSADGITRASLERDLQAQPAIDLTFERISDAQVRVIPKQPLEPGNLYRFTLLEENTDRPLRTWAFQTREPLRVVQTLPADASTNVPLGSGIEVTFSHDGVSGYQDHFSVDPPVEGRFEQHKRVLVFVPKELRPETLYTVTVRAGVKLDGSDLTLAADRVFRFETGAASPSPPDGQTAILGFSRRTFEMPTGEAPVLALFTSQAGAQVSASFRVFRFAGAGQFIETLHQFDSVPGWALYTRQHFSVDTSGMQQVAAFDGQLQPIGRFGDLYIRFPTALPEGFYLVEVRSGDTRAQGWLQMTDIATYTSVSTPRILVWANDLKTQAPLAGASVELPDGTPLGGTTDAEGVAFFAPPKDFVDLEASLFGYQTEQPTSDIIVRARDGRMAVVPLGNVFDGYRYFGYREYPYPGDPSAYWRYAYTDRHLYLPTDTVHFWGIVRPREGNASERDLNVRISGNDASTNYQSVKVGETAVRTSASGTYIGDLPLFDVSPGYYELVVSDDDQVVSALYFEVRDYVKPAYKIDVTPSRQAVVQGDTVDFDVRASYFEGSPLPNAQLTYTGLASGDVTTDAHGDARISAPVNASTSYEYSATLNLTPKLAEEGDITGTAIVRTFPAALAFDVTNTDVKDGSAVLDGSVYAIDFDRLNRPDTSRWADPHGSPVADRAVSADVMTVAYDRTETGETYDFIYKRVQKIYEYRERTTPLGHFETRSGADGSFRFSWPAEADKNYRATITVVDDAGRRFSSEPMVYARGVIYGLSYLMLEDVNAPQAYYSPYGDTPYGYATGDQVSLRFRRSDANLPSGGTNRYLFYRAQNGLRDYTVRADPAYSFTFQADDVPSTSVMAVRFTGATFEEVNYPFTVPFDPAERKLNITIEADKDRYEPGDEATLHVTTTDRDGRALPAEVLLSGVDESVFAIEDQWTAAERDILPSLYTPVRSGILRTYASHFYPFEMNAAERGGGGGPRADFKDVALFNRVQTGSDGKGSITFKLPDNLTSWRITALGVTDGLLAGSALKQLPVGLPFFAEIVANRDYLTSDQVTLRVRAMGTALSANDDVSFELTSESLGISEPIRASGKAFSPVDIALPQLREGEQTLLLKATSGDHEDSLERVINVLPARLVQTQARFYDASDSAQLEGSSDGATTVIFSDQGRGRYYPILQQLSWTWGDRVDQMLARDLAQQLLHEQFGVETYAPPADFQSSLYQRPDGAIAIYPYADGDLLLSARIADVAPDRFGRQTLSPYFEKIASDGNETRERSIIAVYGLAALGEPVLGDVHALAALTDLTWREQLYVGLAAAALGDDNTARGLYRGLLQQYGQQRGPWIRIKTGDNEDDILEGTSLLAILGASLGDDLAPGIFDYTTQNYTHDILVQLEQISYLRRALPRLPSGKLTFEYMLDGSRKRATLEKGETLALRVSPEQLRALAPRAIEGQLGVTTLFLAPLDPHSITPDTDVSVSRRIEAVDGGAIEEGKLVRITIDWSVSPAALDGCYQVSDLLPSGLRPVTRLRNWDLVSFQWYPYAVRGQRVSFCVSKDAMAHYLPIVYYARVVNKGTFLAEPAIIQSQKAPESINLTPAQTIEVR
jgi:hypothetical protein